MYQSVSASVGSSEDDSQSSDVESLEPHPPKKTFQLNLQGDIDPTKITRNGKRISCGWNMTTIIKEQFVMCVESRSLSHFKKLEVQGLPSHSRTGKG